LSCWILASERIVLLWVRQGMSYTNSSVAEANSWVYFMRLFAFLLIMIGIVDKNRRSAQW
jgi:hypothetical protein